ncbi:hypothetical protein D9619_013755 [Psilocybe cf. subviscida]|uniref:PIN domain-containing protein n=1 Tax=Psilocybe cf. subviscida TaxID=2480587 RepID=A0A8H5BH54_9AGAR|nr:hypothetical protein D9619_006926 [Psilocybe cf. subviscida]KAF5317584.1 hypothetical protein D9619_013231 [Psilocybe cf. subviscida]KAF5323190.1 hypothetical protein D9619_013755 [Psilocybe cf. subviscida]
MISRNQESEEDENDLEEVKALKVHRRYLKSLLQSTRQSALPAREARGPCSGRCSADDEYPQLCIAPGYTILVINTNILLSSLSAISSLIELQKWTVVILLPVVMELDGLLTNILPQLNEATQTAEAAMAYIAGHIRSHLMSLATWTSETTVHHGSGGHVVTGKIAKSLEPVTLKADKSLFFQEAGVERICVIMKS